MVVDLDGTGGHLVKTLVNDAQRLSEFLHSAEVSVVLRLSQPGVHVVL